MSRLKSNQPDKICGIWEIWGDAAKLVIDKTKEEKEIKKVRQYGKNRAVQALLCELYKIKMAANPTPQQDQAASS